MSIDWLTMLRCWRSYEWGNYRIHRLLDQAIKQPLRSIILRIPLQENDVGPAVTIIRAGSYDINKFKFQDIIRVGSMFGEIMMMEDDNATVSGYFEIMDMTGIGAANLFALQPQLLRKFSAYADEAMPTRQKGIQFINVPAAFESGFNSLRSFFPVKIKSRVSRVSTCKFKNLHHIVNSLSGVG